MAESLKLGDLTIVREEAIAQVNAGARILDVNVVTSGVDEIVLLPRVVQVLMEAVDVPISIDINNPKALEEVLKIYKGKPIVNSVTGEEDLLNDILPLVKEYGTAVIGLTIDEEGIPKDLDKRLVIANKIVERAHAFGIPIEDVIIDCLALTIGADSQAGLVTLEAIRKVREQLGVNQTLGVSNISFGLPNRPLLNQIFLSMAIAAGVTCPIVDVDKIHSVVLATDLVLGLDKYAMRYIKNYRSS